MGKPNIILIMSDNQQAATLGCYGNTEVHTPNLDAMAEQGLRFDRAFCPNAFCSPCRASVLTGTIPSAHGVHSWIDDRNMETWPKGWHALEGQKTLPQALKKLGYRTGLFGKYHLGESATPGAGWDDWVTMEHGHVRSFYNNQIVDNGVTYEQPGHAVDFFTDKALDFIARTKGPSFTFVPYPAPYGHWPATNDEIPNRFTDLYADCPMHSIPRQGLSAAAVASYDRVKEQSGGGLDFSMLMRAPNHLPSLRNYYSQISMIDEAVGRLLQADPNALVIYTADHGLSLGHHGFWGHGASTYPSNLHMAAHSIPLIVRALEDVKGQNSLNVSNMDIYATVLDYVGGESDISLPSRSLAALIRGEELTGWGADEVFSEQEETRVIRTTEWVYFKRLSHENAPSFSDELYNAKTDRHETKNLADDPDYANIVTDLSNRIDAFFDQHARADADMWKGGQPIQNSMMAQYWRNIWGPDWGPVYCYD